MPRITKDASSWSLIIPTIDRPGRVPMGFSRKEVAKWSGPGVLRGIKPKQEGEMSCVVSRKGVFGWILFLRLSS
jgi:hypothetical protein